MAPENGLLALEQALNRVLFGQEMVIHSLLATVIAGGHILLEGLPGLGKTLLAQGFSQGAGLSQRRIQFTPDLLPADITGTPILREGQFIFEPGPIYAQVVLADEINRATPKTQSALLEAMQERTLTVAGESYPLPEPFLVIATQNPVEVEGTYPLPEAQLDRFMSKIEIKAPPRAFWLRILTEEPTLPAQIVDERVFLGARKSVAPVAVASSALEAIANLAFLASEHPKLRFGISPRGVKAWLALAKSMAYLEGRGNVEWDDLRRAARPALIHRLFLKEEAQFEGVQPDEVLAELLQKTMPR